MSKINHIETTDLLSFYSNQNHDVQAINRALNFTKTATDHDDSYNTESGPLSHIYLALSPMLFTAANSQNENYNRGYMPGLSKHQMTQATLQLSLLVLRPHRKTDKNEDGRLDNKQIVSRIKTKPTPLMFHRNRNLVSISDQGLTKRPTIQNLIWDVPVNLNALLLNQRRNSNQANQETSTGYTSMLTLIIQENWTIDQQTCQVTSRHELNDATGLFEHHPGYFESKTPDNKAPYLWAPFGRLQDYSNCEFSGTLNHAISQQHDLFMRSHTQYFPDLKIMAKYENLFPTEELNSTLDPNYLTNYIDDVLSPYSRHEQSNILQL